MKTCILFFILVFSTSIAREHVIYSIAHSVPMGEKDELLKKNYYLNLGLNQGVKIGDILNVSRIISNSNPYNDQKRINHKVQIGQVKIIHSENESAIAIASKVNDGAEVPLFELEDFMIGDHLDVSVE